jgi:hypothetical protein
VSICSRSDSSNRSNNGTAPIKLTANSIFLPQCLSFASRPAPAGENLARSFSGARRRRVARRCVPMVNQSVVNNLSKEEARPVIATSR